ncbi:MAG: DUF2157 domain-containing protein [Zoogloeaceae bacterium]|nr:DUF2157 domain-containing protein [Zoogloeaceae bacterium]
MLLLLWARQGQIDPACLPEALRLAGAFPSVDDWRRFADRVLLALAVLALSSGLIFFFAYNWSLGHWGRFALAEGALILALFGVWRLGLARPSGQSSLFAAALSLGALLALIGQTYQTGADTWERFAVWCVLILPWALLGRLSLLWLFWLALLNVALFLYLAPGFESDYDWRKFFFVNLCALALWEGAGRRFAEFRSRLAPRLVALVVACFVTYGAVKNGIWENWKEASWGNHVQDGKDALLIWALWGAGCWYFYRYRARDFFPLALVAASFLPLVSTALICLRIEFAWPYGEFSMILLTGALIVGITLGLGFGLWRVHERMLAEARERIARDAA